jgi:XTP/dITP diphosphohydrolase
MMLKELIFASANENKIAEIASKLGGAFILKGLKDIGCFDELPETTGTIPGNAQQKAQYVWDHYKVNCFADDTGLEIDALNQEPGVDSADYAKADRNAEANMQLVLAKLAVEKNRNARFRTVICLLIDGQSHVFEGTVDGIILLEKTGNGGFGYDPIFKPNGCEKSFGEMTLEEKNEWSHRARAFHKLKDFLMQ